MARSPQCADRASAVRMVEIVSCSAALAWTATCRYLVASVCGHCWLPPALDLLVVHANSNAAAVHRGVPVYGDAPDSLRVARPGLHLLREPFGRPGPARRTRGGASGERLSRVCLR